jgi:hypothetical protein
VLSERLGVIRSQPPNSVRPTIEVTATTTAAQPNCCEFWSLSRAAYRLQCFVRRAPSDVGCHSTTQANLRARLFEEYENVTFLVSRLRMPVSLGDLVQ